MLSLRCHTTRELALVQRESLRSCNARACARATREPALVQRERNATQLSEPRFLQDYQDCQPHQDVTGNTKQSCSS
jgi:hypothetical protein